MQQGAPSLPGTDSLPQRHGCHNKNPVLDPQAWLGPFVMTLLYLFGAAVMGSQESSTDLLCRVTRPRGSGGRGTTPTQMVASTKAAWARV